MHSVTFDQFNAALLNKNINFNETKMISHQGSAVPMNQISNEEKKKKERKYIFSEITEILVRNVT